MENKKAGVSLKISKAQTSCKPYWIIEEELKKELDIVINSPVKTEYCKKGTVSRFRGKIIGYNMSYQDILAYKQTQEHTLRYNRAEILMYESCLYNLRYDNNYLNIRSIFIMMRKQIGSYVYSY